MRVILLQDVPGLGRVGDIKTVSDGYGRNFLIAKGLAKIATSAAVKLQTEIRRQQEIKEEKYKEEANLIKAKINNLSIELTLKTGESGEIFGSISQQDILRYLSEHDIKLEKRMIKLEKPIKNPGEYKIPVLLYPGIQAELNLKIIPEMVK